MKTKTYNVKYDVSDKVFVDISGKILEVEIKEIRIIDSDIVRIHYLVIFPEVEIYENVYKNFEWIDQKQIIEKDV